MQKTCANYQFATSMLQIQLILSFYPKVFFYECKNWKKKLQKKFDSLFFSRALKLLLSYNDTWRHLLMMRLDVHFNGLLFQKVWL